MNSQLTMLRPSKPRSVIKGILDLLLGENLQRAAVQGEAPPPAEESDEEDDG